jgi:glycosidase
MEKLNWWQKGIIYQVYIKSFKDSNGDGIGDLKGVIEKIDYFKLIGVDIIFLNPFYPNAGKDNGYDVVSYNEIDPIFGTMDDFDELVDKLHKNSKLDVTQQSIT